MAVDARHAANPREVVSRFFENLAAQCGVEILARFNAAARELPAGFRRTDEQHLAGRIGDDATDANRVHTQARASATPSRPVIMLISQNRCATCICDQPISSK